MNCRFCNTKLTVVFADLGFSPPSNSLLKLNQLNKSEPTYPLKTYVCHKCFLVQIDEYKSHESIFNNEYVYFSSYSTSWLKHCEEYCNMIIRKFKLNNDSLVIEVASNDGYLLQYFKKNNIPVMGIEPTQNTANEAIKKGIPTVVDFMSVELANKLLKKEIKCDLILGNNVLAHVPNIIDFVSGFKILLKDEGVITMEFPHLLELIKNNQFDTIYHEHFSYLSLYFVNKLFISLDLRIFDVQKLSTHGGSLRIFGTHYANEKFQNTINVKNILEEENGFGLTNIEKFKLFKKKPLKIKYDLSNFFNKYKNKKIIAYGAAAKGNTLLNYCKIESNQIKFIVDLNPYKHNMFSPGTHIKIVSESNIKKFKPDYILILPWNLKDEISNQLKYTREWGCKFVVAIPKLDIF